MWIAQSTTSSLGDWASWAAAFVAAVSAIFGFWQAREAKKAREAAQKQAGHAADQATAARDQVRLMEAERHERNAPTFSVDAVDSEGPMQWAAKFDLHMEDGPRLASVRVRPSGSHIDGSPFVESYPEAKNQEVFTDVGVGSTLTFYVPCTDGYQGSGGIIDIHCVEEGGEGRSWDTRVGFRIHPRPPERTGRIWD